MRADGKKGRIRKRWTTIVGIEQGRGDLQLGKWKILTIKQSEGEQFRAQFERTVVLDYHRLQKEYPCANDQTQQNRGRKSTKNEAADSPFCNRRAG